MKIRRLAAGIAAALSFSLSAAFADQAATPDTQALDNPQQAVETTAPTAPAAPIQTTAPKHYTIPDLQKLLFKTDDRTIELKGNITSQMAEAFEQALKSKIAEDPESDIVVMITSNGGSVPAGSKMLDLMNLSPVKIHTVCTERAMSMAAVLCTANMSGGYRVSTANSDIMIHGPAVVMPPSPYPQKVDQNDVDNYKVSFAYNRAKLANSLCAASDILKGDPKRCEYIEELVKKEDHFLTPEEAMALGLLDAVLKPAKFNEDGAVDPVVSMCDRYDLKICEPLKEETRMAEKPANDDIKEQEVMPTASTQDKKAGNGLRPV